MVRTPVIKQQQSLRQVSVWWYSRTIFAIACFLLWSVCSQHNHLSQVSASPLAHNGDHHHAENEHHQNEYDHQKSSHYDQYDEQAMWNIITDCLKINYPTLIGYANQVENCIDVVSYKIDGDCLTDIIKDSKMMQILYQCIEKSM